jgi:hypothetical protein
LLRALAGDALRVRLRILTMEVRDLAIKNWASSQKTRSRRGRGRGRLLRKLRAQLEVTGSPYVTSDGGSAVTVRKR